MIRLTVNAQSQPEIHLFNKPVIIIGSSPGEADLVLLNEELTPTHLKITEIDGCFILVNLANDPFISLNGHPFGKKLLNSGDVILVRDTEILFENLMMRTADIPAYQPADTDMPDPLSNPGIILPFEQEIKGFTETEWQTPYIQELVKDLDPNNLKNWDLDLAKDAGSDSSDSLGIEQSAGKADPISPQMPSSNELAPNYTQTGSLKDDYLREWEDTPGNQPPFFNASFEPNHLFLAWKWLLIFIFSLLGIFLLVGAAVYFSVSDKTEDQEIKATQGIADLAIALAYARIEHLQPLNQNWADMDFLKGCLNCILDEIPSFTSQIDAHGQFKCCPYSLRIYTNNDLSHFLLIGQPAPSLLHWLVPKSVIVVDSQFMELRTTKDVRNLNRLLATNNPLEGANGKAISNLVKQGHVISLISLAQDSGNQDFSPPKNLTWIRPGAENLIYNAPRYHLLGKGLIQKALTLSSELDSRAITSLTNTVANFSKFPNLILYSDQNKKAATHAKEHLKMHVPHTSLLFGYLTFNQQGRIHQAHLLNEDEDNGSLTPNVPAPYSLMALNHPPPSKPEPIHPELQDRSAQELHEFGLKLNEMRHPFYLELRALTFARQQELTPLANLLALVVQEELIKPSNTFKEKAESLLASLTAATTQHNQKIKQHLDFLYREYEHLPTATLLFYIRELQLENLYENALHIPSLNYPGLFSLNPALERPDFAAIYSAPNYFRLGCGANKEAEWSTLPPIFQAHIFFSPIRLRMQDRETVLSRSNFDWGNECSIRAANDWLKKSQEGVFSPKE